MNNNAIEQFIDAVKDPGYETNTTYSAIVSRVDSEGVAWVNLAGSEKETPTASTSADVKAGDVVTVQWRNNKLYIAGNYSDPSAGVIRVANVEAAANTAREAANNAVADAGRARSAAEQAEATAQSVEGIAQRAENAATNAIKGLAQVEDVVDTLNWIATHCQYEKTTDVTIVTGKAYYTVTATQVSSPADADIATYYELVSGAYVKTADTSVVSGKTYYTVVGEPVTNPVVADIGTYYELEITEAVSNYINTHVAVTDEGLWLIPESGGNKVLIAVGGTGHTYEEAGTYIIDDSNNILAKFLSTGVQIGETNTGHVVIDSGSVYIFDNVGLLASFGANGINVGRGINYLLTVSGNIATGSISCDDVNATDIVSENNVKCTNGGIIANNLRGGRVSFGTISANSYADKAVSFSGDYQYQNTPHVSATLFSSGTAVNIGNVCVAVHDVSQSGFTIRVFNNRSASISPAVEWLAIGV